MMNLTVQCRVNLTVQGELMSAVHSSAGGNSYKVHVSHSYTPHPIPQSKQNPEAYAYVRV